MRKIATSPRWCRGLRYRAGAALGGSLSLLALVASPAGATSFAPRVGAGVRVSGPVSWGCSSANGNGPHAAVDPGDPHHISVIYSLGSGAAAAVATSRDGGSSWSRTPLALTKCAGGPDGTVGDPFIAIGSSGRVLATDDWNTNDPNTYLNDGSVVLYANRSDDGGNTFLGPTQPKPSAPDQRGPVSFAERSNSDLLIAYERTNYVNGPYGGFVTSLQLGVSRSTDGGTNYSPPVAAYSTSSGEGLLTVGLLRSGGVAVLVAAHTDATAAASRGSNIQEHLFALRSTDNGGHWAASADFGIYTLPGQNAPGCCIPDSAVAPDGTLYVAWPNATQTAISLARSTDAGQHWQVVPDVPSPSGKVLEPAVAAGTGNTLAVLFYRTTTDTSGEIKYATPVIATSGDAGTTWNYASLAPAFDASAIIQGNADGTSMGPYQDLVALPDGFGATVTARGPNPTAGGQEDVYWYRITR